MWSLIWRMRNLGLSNRFVHELVHLVIYIIVSTRIIISIDSSSLLEAITQWMVEMVVAAVQAQVVAVIEVRWNL